jgi:hypothetical protein
MECHRKLRETKELQHVYQARCSSVKVFFNISISVGYRYLQNRGKISHLDSLSTCTLYDNYCRVSKAMPCLRA